jgi:competence protein ComEA
MKKLISAAVLSLVLAGPAFAQEAKPVVPAAPAAVAPAAPAAATPAAPAAAAPAAAVAPKPAAALPATTPAAAAAAAPAVPAAAATAAGKAVEAVKSAVMPAKPATPVAATPVAAAPAAVAPAKAAPAKKLLNINTATAAELDALPQIGEARTKAIIAGRPYKSLDELATKAKLPSNAIDAIKGLVSTK